MATLTGELISETYDSLLKVTDNNTITGVKKRITDGFGNEIPLQLSSTDIEIDGTLILSSLTDVEVATKFLSLKADNSVAYRTAAEVLSDIGAASSSDLSAYVTLATNQTITGAKTFSVDTIINGINIGRGGGNLTSNTRFGNNSLPINTTGLNNTAIGFNVLASNVIGSSNTAIGHQALPNSNSDNNTAVGLSSLFSLSSGNNNISFGSQSGWKISGGADLTIANNSVFLGYATKALASNQTNQIVIGYDATGNGSNTVTIGNSSITNNYFSGNIRGGAFIKSGGLSSEFLKADGSVDTNTYALASSLSGYVTLDTDQTITGQKSLTSLLIGTRANFTSSGSGDTLGINHSSGSGIALYMTKAGNGEALYINKSSGSGNAVTIVGTLNATTLVKNGGTSSQFLKADGSVDSTAYGTGSVTSVAALTLGTSGTDLNSSVANGTTTPVITLNVPNASEVARGVITTGTQRIGGQKTFDSGLKITTGTSTAIISATSFSGDRSYGFPTSDGFLTTTVSEISSGIAKFDSGNRLLQAVAGTDYVVPSALSSYLPLSGGTLTGALFGTTASFASSIGLTSASSSSSLTSTTNGIEISVDGSTSSNKNTIFKVGSSETMRINASGNLGLGVTPSAWGSVLKAFDIGTSGSLVSSASGAGGLSVARNAYYNGSAWIYKNNSTAQFYEQDAGQHAWYTAPSGTAGNTISFTQAMTLNASGNLLIGTTTDSSKLYAVGSSTQNGLFISSGSTSSHYVALFRNNTESLNIMSIKADGNVGIGTTSPAVNLQVTNTSGELFRLTNTTGGERLHFYTRNSASNSRIGSQNSSLQLFSEDVGFDLLLGTSNTERMRITSGGNVLIGTTSDNGAKLQVSGGINTSGDSVIATTFSFINLENNSSKINCSRFLSIADNGQSVGIGYTNDSIPYGGKFFVNGNSLFSANINSFKAFEFSNTNNTSGNGVLVTNLGSNCNNTSSYHLIAGTGGADKFYLYGNGVFATVSDIRLKKNIKSVEENYLEKVLALDVVNYNWNDQEEGHQSELGLIAQQVEESIPFIINENRPNEDGNVYKSIQVSALPYILIKALQESNEIINQLKNRIEVLENK